MRKSQHTKNPCFTRPLRRTAVALHMTKISVPQTIIVISGVYNRTIFYNLMRLKLSFFAFCFKIKGLLALAFSPLAGYRTLLWRISYWILPSNVGITIQPWHHCHLVHLLEHSKASQVVQVRVLGSSRQSPARGDIFLFNYRRNRWSNFWSCASPLIIFIASDIVSC